MQPDTLRAHAIGVLLDEPIPEPRPQYGALTDSHFDSLAKANMALMRDLERYREAYRMQLERVDGLAESAYWWRRAALVAGGVVVLAVGVMLVG
jgi:hypothetical protein